MPWAWSDAKTHCSSDSTTENYLALFIIFRKKWKKCTVCARGRSLKFYQIYQSGNSQHWNKLCFHRQHTHHTHRINGRRSNPPPPRSKMQKNRRWILTIVVVETVHVVDGLLLVRFLAKSQNSSILILDHMLNIPHEKKLAEREYSQLGHVANSMRNLTVELFQNLCYQFPKWKGRTQSHLPIDRCLFRFSSEAEEKK